MGLKLNLILGGLLLSSIACSAWYIDRLQDHISTLNANAQILETQIADQNAKSKQHLEKQQKTQEQINTLTAKNQESQREVNKLRNTFAKHDLDNLALAKPKLIENIVNKGTKKVKDELIALTNPNQFDESDEENNS